MKMSTSPKKWNKKPYFRGKRGKMANRVARAFVTAISDINNTSSEEPSSEEEEPPKKENKEKKTVDNTELCFAVDDDYCSDQLDTSEGGDADRLSTVGD
ncbi:hypothetical protein GUJ93_ZPchr0010g9349 [Zizania palustris]|uniref:Uncharacterized protein n=1 Tax=Zizania palustris TaxID=103762 RepID=A0A8J6BNS3_ZIZPA|nr:hypothetical protein GUJ93_ZPchr0010g9349 [Zizania palustris]